MTLIDLIYKDEKKFLEVHELINSLEARGITDVFNDSEVGSSKAEYAKIKKENKFLEGNVHKRGVATYYDLPLYTTYDFRPRFKVRIGDGGSVSLIEVDEKNEFEDYFVFESYDHYKRWFSQINQFLEMHEHLLKEK